MPEIWLIEDNPAFREASEIAIRANHDDYTCHTFESVESAVDALKRKQALPDVVLLDVGLPGVDGITGIKQIKSLAPETAILILTVFDDDEKIFQAICAGALGYLLKSESLQNLSSVIEQAIAGGSPMNPQVARRVLAMFSKFAPVKNDYGLSTREREILERMVEGYSKKEIAAQLEVSPHTVNTFVRSMYKKLHVNCQTAAVSMALRKGLVDR